MKIPYRYREIVKKAK